MITDNLAPLFDGAQPGARFRQGTVVAWNAETGENTIDLGGGTLTDVPILNTGEAVALRAGHVVGLLGQGSAWFILGRVTPPNDPSFASASLAFDGAFGFTTNFAISTVRATKVTATLQVPAWVDEAAVFCVVNASLRNPTATATYVDVYATVAGSLGIGQRNGFAPSGNATFQDAGSISSSAQNIISDPGPTILCEGSLQTITTNWATDAAQTIGISAIAIYRSIT